MSKTTFASQGDLGEKKKSFLELAPGAYGYTAEGDPNSGVIIGDEAVMVIEAQATPLMAADLIAHLRSVTDKPIKYLLLTHYHAVRVLGASAYGAQETIASHKTWEMIMERGQQDWLSEFQRFPRLFRGHESIPGLTYPTMTFTDKMTLDLGNKKVEIMHLGEGHTRGDAVAWLPEDRVLFAGDLVEFGATPYCGDAQLGRWKGTLRKLSTLRPKALVPGRGEALTDEKTCQKAIKGTAEFTSMLLEIARQSVEKGETLKQCHTRLLEEMRPKFGHWVIFEHCMPFNTTRAFDEAGGIIHPRIWTAERDLEMWAALNG
jgi:glyoxylase-like metal-dependent hydrolase (beta-lactamase superfamily II)